MYNKIINENVYLFHRLPCIEKSFGEKVQFEECENSENWNRVERSESIRNSKEFKRFQGKQVLAIGISIKFI